MKTPLVIAAVALGLAGCTESEPALQVFIASKEVTPDYEVARTGPEGRPFYLAREPLVSADHVRHAEWSTSASGQRLLILTLNQDGAATMESAANSYVGRYLAFVTGDTLLSVPFVHSPLGEKLGVMGEEADLATLFAKLND